MSPRRGRAVVADDDPDQRAMLATLLGLAGFEVSTLHDGSELLDVLLMTPRHHFQLVVTDQRMPGLHGTEVLARTSSRATGFIVVTAFDTPALREQATKLGAAALVRKPIDVPAFLALVDHIV